MSTNPLYQQAVALVGMMEDEEREKLAAYIDSLRPQEHASAPATLDVYDPVDILVEFISDGGGKTPPNRVLTKSRQFLQNRWRIELAWSWVCGVAKLKIERKSLFLFGCKCLRNHMFSVGLPIFMDKKTGKMVPIRFKSVGLYEMLSNLDHLPDAVEAAFPDYTRSGLILGVALGNVSKKKKGR